MESVDYYICYTEVLAQDEIDLINAYWELSADKIYPFKYKLSQLDSIKTFSHRRILSNYVIDRSFFSSNSCKFDCRSCGRKLLFSSREMFRTLSKNIPSICRECEKKITNEVAASYLNRLGDILKSIKVRPLDEKPLEKLSYINILFLTILTDHVNIQPIKSYDIENMITGVIDLENEIINDLSEIGLIYACSESSLRNLHIEYNLAHKFFIKNEKQIDYKMASLLNELPKSFPKIGIHVLIPESFDTIQDYKYFLNSGLIYRPINDSDLKSIYEIIINIKKNLAYVLLNTSINKYNIKTEKNHKLDSLLSFLVEKYSMPIVYSFINLQCKNAAASFQSNPSAPYYVRNKYLAKIIENNLKYLEKSPTFIFPKELPKFIAKSKIEIFFLNWLGPPGLMTWEKLSVEKIVEFWVNTYEINVEIASSYDNSQK
ncbi:MAG TPA: hypothetical protein VMV35_11575 [Halothiobacillus sp.]|nr:hypothetical protein [Halothiobacillus sp.]